MKRQKIIYSIIGICILALSVCLCFVLRDSKEMNQNTEIGGDDISKENRKLEIEKDLAQSPIDLDFKIDEDEEESAWVCEYWSDIKIEYWSDLKREWDLPYADDIIVAILKDAYEEITFKGTFERGNIESYNKYKSLYMRLLDNEIPFSNLETGEKVYLKDFKGLELHIDTELPYDKYRYVYFFFDMDEDGAPELGIRNEDNHNAAYIFKYAEETEEYYLWYTLENFYYELLGSRKVTWDWGGQYWDFCQLDKDGDLECEAFGLSNRFSEEENLNVIMLPEYRDEEKKIEVTDIMKKQGIYERSHGRWFFRVTDEQYEELMKPYQESLDLARKEIEEVTFSYEELFDGIQ